MKALVSNRGVLTRIPNLVTQKSFGTGAVVKEVPRPIIADNEILIEVRATALNPIDNKFIDFIAPRNSLLGCDFSGEVLEVGENAPGYWKIGDRVAGMVQGGVGKEFGCFAQYVKAEGDLVWRVPTMVSHEAASAYGLSAVTAMQALNVHLDVPWTDDAGGSKKEHDASPVFIYAGSSAVGLFAIQLAKKAGCTVVTTASPHSFDLVKSYGADEVFDRRDPTATEKIRKAFPNIARALDCFSDSQSASFCAQVLRKGSGGKVITLLDTKVNSPTAEVKMIMSFQLLGRAFAWLPPVGPRYPASSSEREALVHFYAILPSLLSELRAPPLTILDGGFDGVLEGLKKLRAGKVSGSKLVVKY